MTDIYAVGGDIVDEMVAQRPSIATYLGVPGYDHLWDDFSVEGREAQADLLRHQLRRVKAVDTVGDQWAELGARVAAEALATELSWYDDGEAFRHLNSTSCPIQHIREIFDQMSTDTSEAWENIATRLETLGGAMDGYRQTIEQGRRSGMAVARRQVIDAVRQARNFAGDASPFNDLPASADLAAVGDDALTARVIEAASTARAAYSGIADYLEQDYLPSAAERDAVGRERYVGRAEYYLGDRIDPNAAYDWGWSEVTRLRERMVAVGELILPGGTLAEVFHLLKTDPARAAHSQAEFRDLMEARLHEALEALDGVHFDVPESIRRLDVKMAPPGGDLGAYYVSPSEDFSRAGSVWWAKGDQQVIPLFDEVSTAYHEGFPGHHLQAGLQMAAGDRFTRYHKLLVWYSGSGEGWALYAEDLMDELGYLDKPDYVMGKLAAEMLRACRIVIDIGSHLELPIPHGQAFRPGEAWTFEAGVDMLENYAAQGHDLSISEMNRYLGWPGQAIAYKIGQQMIRDLRTDAQRRQGAAFDPKVFHSRLLEIGAPGLSVVRRYMRQAGTAR